MGCVTTQILPLFSPRYCEWAWLASKVIVADERLTRRGINNRPVAENTFWLNRWCAYVITSSARRLVGFSMIQGRPPHRHKCYNLIAVFGSFLINLPAILSCDEFARVSFWQDSMIHIHHFRVYPRILPVSVMKYVFSLLYSELLISYFIIQFDLPYSWIWK